jgi:hypothetical protein
MPLKALVRSGQGVSVKSSSRCKTFGSTSRAIYGLRYGSFCSLLSSANSRQMRSNLLSSSMFY